MKTIIICCILGLALSAPQNLFTQQDVVVQKPVYAILRDERSQPSRDGSFSYEFESENGIYEYRSGRPSGLEDGGIVMEGSYSFIDENGNKQTVNYIADENGYRAESPLIPTQAPFEPYVLEQIRFAEEQRLRKLREEQAGERVNIDVRTPIQRTTFVQQPIERTNVVAQPVRTTFVQQPVQTRFVQQPVQTTFVEQPVETTFIEEPVDTTFVEQPVQTRFVQQPAETQISEQLAETSFDEPKVQTISKEEQQTLNVQPIFEAAPSRGQIFVQQQQQPSSFVQPIQGQKFRPVGPSF